MKKAQSIFEYFLLFGVIAALVVVSSGGVRNTIRSKLIEYRDEMGDRAIGR